jgi:uncharacterized membrane protein YqgA involved in biofilm formation
VSAVVGLGTIINVVAIMLGAALGVLIGHRLQKRTSEVVTDSLGLVTLVLGALNVASLSDSAFVDAVGGGGTLLVVLASLLIGGITGSLLRLEQRLEGFGAFLQSRFSRTGSSESKKKFIDGFVAASLIFTIGPLAILGALSDGLGQGIEQLALKSALDGFASIAFAASMGWGVAAAAIPVAIWQGSITALAAILGASLSAAAVSSMTATGGVLLLGVGLRLLGIRQVSVADMLPSLIVAPLVTYAVAVIAT